MEQVADGEAEHGTNWKFRTAAALAAKVRASRGSISFICGDAENILSAAGYQTEL
jgi:hypothetical protein